MRTALLAASTSLALASAVSAQCGNTPTPDLTAPVPSASAYYGESVRTDGFRAIVGAYGDGALGANAGAAYVYLRTPGGWVLETQLTAPDGAATDEFGLSAGIDWQFAVVGAHHDDDRGSNSGSATIFRNNGTSWSFLQKLTAFDGDAGDGFGRIVVARGGFAVVGAPSDETVAPGAGSAYVYRWNGISYGYVDKLAPLDLGADDLFGKSLAMANFVLVAGAPDHDEPGFVDAGKVYVYRLAGSHFSLFATLTSPSAQANERFGVAVAADGLQQGETIVVGASQSDEGGLTDCGAAYVYRVTEAGEAVVFEQRLLASDRQPNDRFGWTVAVEGDTILVGALREDAGGVDAGAVYEFRRFGLGWVERAKLVAPMPEAHEQLGMSIDVREGHAMLGANQATAAGAALAGRVVTFEIGLPCVETMCTGDGAVTACPCGNSSPAGQGRGCLNSTGFGAQLVASGSASVGADTLALSGSSMTGASALFFQGTAASSGGYGDPFGDGKRCAGGAVIRLGVESITGGASAYPGAGDQTVSVRGAVGAGQTRFYQAWYRNSAVFCTSATFNTTNGMRVIWSS